MTTPSGLPCACCTARRQEPATRTSGKAAGWVRRARPSSAMAWSRPMCDAFLKWVIVGHDHSNSWQYGSDMFWLINHYTDYILTRSHYDVPWCIFGNYSPILPTIHQQQQPLGYHLDPFGRVARRFMIRVRFSILACAHSCHHQRFSSWRCPPSNTIKMYMDDVDLPKNGA